MSRHPYREVTSDLISLSPLDPERDYKNLVLAWKYSFEQYKKEFEAWKAEECNSG